MTLGSVSLVVAPDRLYSGLWRAVAAFGVSSGLVALGQLFRDLLFARLSKELLQAGILARAVQRRDVLPFG